MKRLPSAADRRARASARYWPSAVAARRSGDAAARAAARFAASARSIRADRVGLASPRSCARSPAPGTWPCKFDLLVAATARRRADADPGRRPRRLDHAREPHPRAAARRRLEPAEVGRRRSRAPAIYRFRVTFRWLGAARPRALATATRYSPALSPARAPARPAGALDHRHRDRRASPNQRSLHGADRQHGQHAPPARSRSCSRPATARRRRTRTVTACGPHTHHARAVRRARCARRPRRPTITADSAAQVDDLNRANNALTRHRVRRSSRGSGCRPGHGCPATLSSYEDRNSPQLRRGSRALHVRQRVHHPLDPVRDPRRDLLRVPPVLHGSPEAGRHRWPGRALPAARGQGPAHRPHHRG